MKKILVSGYIGFNNFGDEAIFKSLFNHLQNDCEISVLSNNRNYPCKIYSRFDIFRAVRENDILISGGGSLLQNKTSNLSLIYYLAIIFFAKLFFKKVIIFAQGIEPIKGKFFQIITKQILKICDFISVRDEKSQKLLADWGIKSILLSDPIYSLLNEVKIKEDKKDLIIQLRDIKNLNKKFLGDLAQIIKDNYTGKITVLALQKDIDKDICQKFIIELKKKNIVANYFENDDIDETIKLINSSKYLISMRLHGLIVANALQTNSFALSYDEKIKTLVQEFNLSNIDVYNYDFEDFNNKIKEFFKDYQDNKTSRHQYRNFVWDEIDSLIKD